LQLYSLREELPKDVKGTLEKVAQAGYKEVELYGFSTKDQFWGLTPVELKKILDANGLKAVSGHYSLGTYFADDDMQELMASIEACKVLGSKFLTIPWLAPEVRSTEEGYKNVAAKLNEIGEMCRASGIKASYHNHDFEFAKFGDVTGYDILLKNTNKKLVDFELDLYWLVRSGNDPKAFFAANSGRFTMWHVKDMDKTDPKLNAEVGTGSIDFKAIFAEAKVAGMKNFFVEHETNYKPNPMASVAQSCNYVKTELI
ncbi:MAG: sugar phosphate isomerase/epimerase, partial [Pedobacter sp.]